MKVNVKKVNAFTTSSSGGNPAGVVLDSPTLSEAQMKQISKDLCVSETAFVYPSKTADFKIRFFAPAMEVDLCGHATIATFFALAWEKIIKQKDTAKVTVKQETRLGVLPVDLRFKNKSCDLVMMTQWKPVMNTIAWDLEAVASALHIRKDEIDTSLPKQRVSTGLFTLPICIKSYATLKRMQPDFIKIRNLCNAYEVGSFHVFTFETLEKSSSHHARNFAPLYGVNEDPVTGTANGAVGSYLVQNGLVKKKKMICEQGDIIGRSGRVYVEITAKDVRVGGKAVLVEEKTVDV